MPPENSPALSAADIMTADPRTCSTFSTVLEAVLIFRDADCGAVPVLEDGKPVGVLTDRDVALALANYESGLSALPVGELMSRDVVSVPPDAPLSIISDKFGDKGVRRLLVIDADDQLVGIISWADFAPYASDQRVGQVVSRVVEQP